jgi:uncharacterized membrane protein SpoIIM required for sporulation
VDQAGRRGIATLSHQELQELGLLYRQTAADLSTVRDDRTTQQLAGHLNQLLGRAHNLIYMGRRTTPRGILRFYLLDYPAIFRATLPYTLAAMSLFVAGALSGSLISMHDPGFRRFILGAKMLDTIERREMWTHSIVAITPLASSAILTNNLVVSFGAFATGILAGVGTAYMMLFNGLLIGVIGTACWMSGMNMPLWSFVAPHGVLELPAIFIAGGGGLLLAKGLLFPGLLPRGESLTAAGGQAVRLVLGIIPMLIVAGVIEGFVSPTGLAPGLKFLLAATLGTLLVVYLWEPFRGRT